MNRDKEAKRLFDLMREQAKAGDLAAATETNFDLNKLISSDEVSDKTYRDLSERSLGFWMAR